MKINNAMHFALVRELMGPEATHEEAVAMIDILRYSGFSDTRDIPQQKWAALCDLTVAESLRPLLP